MRLFFVLLLALIGVNARTAQLSTECRYTKCTSCHLPKVFWECNASVGVDGKRWNVPTFSYLECDKFYGGKQNSLPAPRGIISGEPGSTSSDGLIRIDRAESTVCMIGSWYIHVRFNWGHLNTYVINENLVRDYNTVANFNGDNIDVYIQEYSSFSSVDLVGYRCVVESGRNNDGQCCESSGDCKSGLCVGGTCQWVSGCYVSPSLNNNGECCRNRGDDCRSGLCNNGKCQQKSCSPDYRNSGLSRGPPDACCNTSKDCCGSCNSGYCSVHAEGDCGRCIRNDHSGQEGECCTTINDCRGGCFNNKCTKINSCYPNEWGTGDGKGLGDHCCRDSNDCKGSCKNGMCTPENSCDREMRREDGVLGDCCQTNNDCQIICDTTVGKCRNSNLACPSGSMTGKDGACCKLASHCKSGKCPVGRCVGNGPSTIGPLPTGDGNCIPGWCGKGTGKGPIGACCSVEGDCDDTCNGNGKCGEDDGTWKGPLSCGNPTTTKTITPTSTTGGKTCKGGYYGKNLKNGPDGFCCSSVNDCIGLCTFVPGDSYMCTGGSITSTRATTTMTTITIATTTMTMVTTANTTMTAITPTPTLNCITGAEGIEDGESEEGYCCRSSMDCWGECANGVCGPPKSFPVAPRNACKPDGFAYRNGNLPAGYCCSTGDDCLYGTCVGALCGNGNASPCSPPKTTTTTTTTSTKTSGENPEQTSVDFPKIVFPSPMPCSACTFPIAVGGLVISLGGFFVGLIGGHDDDDDTEDANEDDISKVIPSLTPPTFVITGPPVVTSTTSSTSLPTANPFTSITSFMPIPTTATTFTSNGTIATITPSTIVIGTSNNTSTGTVGTSNGTSIGTVGKSTGVVVDTSSGTSIVETITGTTISTIATSATLSTTTGTSKSTTTVEAVTRMTTSSTRATTVTTSTTSTMIPIGKTCKSGYYNKKLKNAPDGSCCSGSDDCVGSCVYIPGDSYMCKGGTITTTSSSATSAITLPTTKPTPACITGHCGLGAGKGPSGACCADHWDCDQVCNGDGRCSNSDDGTWVKKLPCP